MYKRVERLGGEKRKVAKEVCANYKKNSVSGTLEGDKDVVRSVMALQTPVITGNHQTATPKKCSIQDHGTICVRIVAAHGDIKTAK